MCAKEKKRKEAGINKKKSSNGYYSIAAYFIFYGTILKRIRKE